MILNWEKFLEKNINITNLNKIIGDSYGGDKLIRKLVNRESINFDKGNYVVDKIIIDNIPLSIEDGIEYLTINGKWDSEKADKYIKKGRIYKPIFISGNNIFKINQIVKTSDFGSRGPGKNIRIFESIQCLFLLLRQYNKSAINNGNYEELVSEYMNGKIDGLYTSIKIKQDDIDSYLLDNNWKYTFIEVANKLWRNIRNPYLSIDNEYDFYHVSSKENNSPYIIISKKYKEFSEFEKKLILDTNENIEMLSDINISKYNPSDVYLIDRKKKEKILNDLNKTTNIEELTILLDELFDSKLLISISLKKILAPIRNEDNFKIIVNKEVNKELPLFSIDSFLVNKNPNKGISSKISTTSIWKYRNNKEVDVSNRVINFDSSDTNKNQDIDGEIEGSVSRHGKISYNSIIRILKNSKVEYEIQSNKVLRNESEENLLKKINDYIIDIEKIGLPNGYLIIRDFYGTKSILGNKNKLISRLQSLQMILSIAKIWKKDKEKADDIITKILRYALSIQTSKFISPRYLRVL